MSREKAIVLGVDLGTSRFKAAIFDRHGAQRGLGRRDLAPDRGDGQRCELPVDRFWRTLSEAIKEAMTCAGANAGDLAAVAYASQANSFLLLDETYRPLTSILLWPDRRVPKPPPAMRALWARPDFLKVTGLGAEAGTEFAAAKILWFQDRHPRLWRQARYVMTLSDYLVHSLSARRVGDAGTASLLGMLDARNLAWWPTALELLHLDAERLSQPLRPGSVAGAITAEGAARVGLAEGALLAVGNLDHYLAALGAGLDRLAPLSESTGTVTAVVRSCTEICPATGVCFGPAFEPGRYDQLLYSENSAAVLAWYRERFAPELTFEELLEMAGRIETAEAPVALPNADRYPDREGFQGRREDMGHGHYVRAILNSTAASLAELVERASAVAFPRSVLATGGGARSDLWLQTYADHLGCDVLRATTEEPACRGAAMLAARATGWFDNLSQAADAWCRAGRRFSPARAK
ncbi:MAG TPA: hypothetical protein DCX07_14795 [Phycisphaerales bacterium]|nr:hypothetical protein [Phycisphaerales bacterium]